MVSSQLWPDSYLYDLAELVFGPVSDVREIERISRLSWEKSLKYITVVRLPPSLSQCSGREVVYLSVFVCSAWSIDSWSDFGLFKVQSMRLTMTKKKMYHNLAAYWQPLPLGHPLFKKKQPIICCVQLWFSFVLVECSQHNHQHSH